MKPRKVYKYRSGDNSTFERDLETLEENCFFAPSYKMLNDPCETFVLDTFYSQSRIFTKLFKSETDIGMKKVKESFNNLIERKNNVGIYSLSTKFNDELLWAHYGNSHKGFCIEYDMGNLLDNFSNEELYTFPLKYSRVPPQIGLNDVVNGDLKSIVRKISGTKSRHWKSESEIRIIKNVSGKQVYNHKALTSIFLGLNMEEPKKDKLITKFIDRGINFYQMTQAKPLYGFKAIPLFLKEHQKETYLKEIPAKITKTQPVNYKIVKKDYNTIFKKGTIEIVIDKEVNSNSLQWIADLVKRHIFNDAERIFMFYWVKEIDKDKICWATTHFDSRDYEIKINNY